MRRVLMRCSGLLAVLLLSGCAGVPQLYHSAKTYSRADRSSDRDLAPKVDHILDEISCELIDISKRQLANRKYVITILLTLQVDDEVNLTPSLSFIDILPGTARKRVLTENLGLGGARQRSFTSTFIYDSDKLEKLTLCGDRPKKFYRLDGNLGLFEIARDGIGIGSKQTAQIGEAPTPPTFASQIKFVVTRSVGSLGPTWTLTTFTGPGGANGPLNGKALTTDSVSVAFAAKAAPAKPTPAEVAVQAALQSIIEILKQREQQAAGDVAQKQNELRSRKDAANIVGLRNLSRQERERRDEIVRYAEAQVREAQLNQARAVEARSQAEARLAGAQAEARNASDAQSRENAVYTGQALINTMILQNLNVQPR